MRRGQLAFNAFFGNGGQQPRRAPRALEHRLQCACVRWFRLAHPQFTHNLFAVPNGGYRTKVTAAKIKAEGALAGVSDLILLLARGKYHGLLIEVKTKVGRQSEAQKDWQRLIEADGYRYVIVRTTDEFIQVVEDYLNNK